MEIVCRPIIPQQTTDEREINGFAGMRSRFRRRVSLTRDVETETVSVSCLSDLDISIDRCSLQAQVCFVCNHAMTVLNDPSLPVCVVLHFISYTQYSSYIALKTTSSDHVGQAAL